MFDGIIINIIVTLSNSAGLIPFGRALFQKTEPKKNNVISNIDSFLSNIICLIPFSEEFKTFIKKNKNEENKMTNIADDEKTKIPKNNKLDIIIIGTATFASFLMHISETKHELPDIILQSYCNHFLWIDRFAAVTVGLYFFKKFYNQEKQKIECKQNWTITIKNLFKNKIIT